jgi:cellulose synthase/poly-beta-1,6-N-acetylglucosamine synthase-like glycosyltransferase
MYEYLKANEDVGGVCGYMDLKIEQLEEREEVKASDIDFLSRLMLSFFDVQRTQQLEYHFSHLVDKPFEALFDFIHVLPGAFSAYSMAALTCVDDNGENILKEYFKSIDRKLLKNKIKPVEISPIDAVRRILLP